MQNFYITTPIYYVNAAPHIGTLYTTLASDIVARFKRLDGYNVKFLTGTDEHGQKIEKAAQTANLEPQKFVDTISVKFSALFKKMNITNDDFIRTSEARHKKAAIAIWNKLKENGHIYLDKYTGWYSVRDESYFADRELVDGKAPTGAEVEKISEESYFFDLSKWQNKLLDLYKKNPEFVTPRWRLNEVINIVESGLQDLSISRTSFKWGIPIPDNLNHIMYVWVDALTNYIAALGYPDTNTENFKNFWPANVHMIGKDITKFHAIYWPAILMAADLPLPKKIVSHGWWMVKGQKMSKSLKNVIDPLELIKNYGVDPVRYYMMRDVSFGEDGGFSQDALVSRANTELANKVGNLLQRSLSFVYKNFDKKIPNFTRAELENIYSESDIIQEASKLLSKTQDELESFKFNQILERFMLFADSLNAYIDNQAPWKLKHSDIKEAKKVLYITLEATRYLAILLSPFISDSAAKMLNQMQVPNNQRSFKHLDIKFALKHSAIDEPKVIFEKIYKTL